MASVTDRVREETGIDLSNGKLITDVLAPRFGDRLNRVVGDLERAYDVSRKIISAYQGLSVASSASILSVYAQAAKAVGDAYTWLQGQAKKAQNESLARRAATRAAFVGRYLRTDSWSTVCESVKAPSPEDLDLVDQAGGWSAAEHLAQYDPDYVFHVSRVLQFPVLHPAWSTPPYSSPGSTPAEWGGGVSHPYPSLLGGFRWDTGSILLELLGPAFQDRPADLGYIREKYRDKYWGNGANKGSISAENPFDAAVFVKGYGIPPGYQFLFSVGTYPYTSWMGPAGGDPVSPEFDLCPEMAALSAAMHSLTPVHASLPWDEVAVAYTHFVAASGWRRLPLLPEAQVDLGVYLDSDLLPYSNQPGTPIILQNPFPSPTGLQVPWEVVRDIELSFRDFFSLRRSAIYQFGLTSPNFRTACKSSRDPVLSSLAKGNPPPEYKPWKGYDPLGENWFDGTTPTPKPEEPKPGPQVPGPKKPPAGLPFPKGPGSLKGNQGSGGGGAVPVLVGGAVAWLLL